MAESQIEVFREITELLPQSLRQQARRAGLNPSTFTNISVGMRPGLETALNVADALIPADRPELRVRWFEAVGHKDPRPQRGTGLLYEAVFEESTLAALRGLDGLPPEALKVLNEEVRKLLHEHRRQHGIE